MPTVKCPTCKKETNYEGNDFRPFCSERCKLIDFGDWADGKFRLPGQTSLSEEDIQEIEESAAERDG